ncbi:hypothetical protein GGI17_003769 [Coemansia sp. S146]|nr:hypothetical protein GGI17_003769 [Coemansia sp. S146]
MLLFFSSSPERGELDDIPDDVLTSDELDAEALSKMSVTELCRFKCKVLFTGSLLRSNHPEFFNDHFMKHPVIFISMDSCVSLSFGNFVQALCNAVAQKWISETEDFRITILDPARDSFEALKQKLQRYKKVTDLPANEMVNYTARWSSEDKRAALDVLNPLYKMMFKDNNHLRKGLLIGVFEVQMAEMGSGANSIKDIHMIPVEENNIQHSIHLAARAHSGRGMDALTDSFWFNEAEAEQMLDNGTKGTVDIADHKSFILQTIQKRYNGYYIGRFSGKYNPWSVMFYIQNLCPILSSRAFIGGAVVTGNIESAARMYWVATGTTRLIDVFIEKYPNEISYLTESHSRASNKQIRNLGFARPSKFR